MSPILGFLVNSANSERGLTAEELTSKCLLCGITSWLPEMKRLIKEGLAKRDEHPKPVRYKATNKAFVA